MAARPRFISLPLPNPSTRDSLPAEHYPTIDFVLKQLRASSRRLRAVWTSQEDELRVLERLYYKGKNQHRSALFWRRLVEVRRYGARVRETDLPGLVDTLRGSFHADDIKNEKALRIAWAQVPDITYVRRILERMHSATMLMDKAQAQLLIAFGVFTTFMESTSFLPLTVTIIAATSRLNILIGELRDIVEDAQMCVRRILGVHPALRPADQTSPYPYSSMTSHPVPPSGSFQLPGNNILAASPPAITSTRGTNTTSQEESSRAAEQLPPGSSPGRSFMDASSPIPLRNKKKRERKKESSGRGKPQDEIDLIFG